MNSIVNNLIEKLGSDKDSSSLIYEVLRFLSYPIIIRINSTSQIGDQIVQNAKENIKKPRLSFFYNSSIWIRFVFDDKEEQDAIDEINMFKQLGLYEFSAAKEYFDSQMRMQTQNYLTDFNSTKGHATYITPLIYSDELEFRDFFINPNNTLSFKYLKDCLFDELLEKVIKSSKINPEKKKKILEGKLKVFYYEKCDGVDESVLEKINDESKLDIDSEDDNIKYFCSAEELRINGLKLLEPKNDFQTEDVKLRILLLDDKLACPCLPVNQTVENGDNTKDDIKHVHIHKCKECNNCNGKESCKMRVVKKLMSGELLKDEHRNAFNKKTYWADTVNSYCMDKKIEIKQVWEVDKGKLLLKSGSIRDELNNKLKSDSECVQIIGVKDLESALVLMSCCKFDIILLDYLLGDNGQNGRVYSSELFEFLSYDFKRDLKPDIVEMLKNSSGLEDDNLEKFRDEVKLNRGPLDKYWIVPMTSYNSTFLTDLQSKHVQLIDHRWNISQGADPINTPWKFLYKLNEFIDLQLRLSVYTIKQLLCFILYTCEDYIKEFGSDESIDFFDFQSFMGSEYANFMRRYGNRLIIKREAAWKETENPSKNSLCDKSVYATYVWKDFYANHKYRDVIELNRLIQRFRLIIKREAAWKETENPSKNSLCDKSVYATYVWKDFYANHKYRDVIELNRLIQRFLYQASTMHNDRNGQQRLEETFGQLCFFIDTNQKIRTTVMENDVLKELSDKLKELHEKMDKLTSAQICKDRKRNKTK